MLPESHLVPYAVSSFDQGKYLIFSPHPDDEILGCGGTLLYYRNKGYKIKIIFMSDGESSRNINIKRKNQLIAKRGEQAKKVSKKSMHKDI